LRILGIECTNYRNLDGLRLRFSEDLNYLVGENNVGKSNVLNLLDTLFNRASFSREDFRDTSVPIEVTVRIGIDEFESGVFGMLIDPDTGNTMTIEARCAEPNEATEFTHSYTGDTISQSSIRAVNFLKYATVSFDNRTLAFDSNKGVGRLLGSSVTRYREANGKEVSDFFNQEEMTPLLEALDTEIGYVPLLSSFGIRANVDTVGSDALESAISLTDENSVRLQSAGSGLQYVSLAILSILQGLTGLSKRRLESSTFTVDGKKILRGVIAFDEPEIHLHPYMQRRLVRALARIASSSDEGFNKLLHGLIGVDAFEGQLILVTHSPEILERGSYSNIIRLGYKNNTLACANGTEISLDEKEQKQLEAQFTKVREAFFARAAIIVEGQTDEVALPEFAEKLGICPDEKGILIIRAESKESVPGVRGLLESFHVPCVSIVDRDDTDAASEGCKLVTRRRDFEDEWIDALFTSNNQHVFIDLLEEVDDRGRNSYIQKRSLEKAFKKLGFDPGLLPGEDTLRFSISEFDGVVADTPLVRAMMYSWLSARKGIMMPKRLGELTPKESVPECYAELLRKAMELL
jgi:putative ATP-dependent endonuclease of OLD family